MLPAMGVMVPVYAVGMDYPVAPGCTAGQWAARVVTPPACVQQWGLPGKKEHHGNAHASEVED
eukprot:13868231-Alexandrium_andersonii.AAC.1